MQTRRDFLRTAGWAATLGPALLEESLRAAARARAAAATAPDDGNLFDIEQIAEGVYAALARPQLLINSNACIIVNEDEVMVVDTHSKPSAASALISQIRREITPKPVRYVVNTHFHWDHAQGNHAYPAAFPAGVAILASAPTRQLLLELGKRRLEQSLEGVPKQLEELRRALEKTTDAKAQARLRELIVQGEAYLKEMRGASVDLPTVTFQDRLVIHKKSREIHLLFLGRGHTSGDVVVFLPEEKVVATGDLAHGFLPYIADGFPAEWPATLDKLRRLDFHRVSPGHGGFQEGKEMVGYFRNYLEELTGLVKAGMEKGKTVEQLQKELTPAAFKSLRADGYGDRIRANYDRFTPSFPGAPIRLEPDLANNVSHVYQKLKS